MGITVLSDIAVLISMAMTIAYCRSEFNETAFEAKSLGIVVATIIASILLGGVLTPFPPILAICPHRFPSLPQPPPPSSTR
eukprot:1180130-Rhodomonas_salina.1